MKYLVFFSIIFLTFTVPQAFSQYMGNQPEQSNDEPYFFGPAIRQTPDYYYIIPAIVVSVIIGVTVFVIWRKRQ